MRGAMCTLGTRQARTQGWVPVVDYSQTAGEPRGTPQGTISYVCACICIMHVPPMPSREPARIWELGGRIQHPGCTPRAAKDLLWADCTTQKSAHLRPLISWLSLRECTSDAAGACGQRAESRPSLLWQRVATLTVAMREHPSLTLARNGLRLCCRNDRAFCATSGRSWQRRRGGLEGGLASGCGGCRSCCSTRRRALPAGGWSLSRLRCKEAYHLSTVSLSLSQHPETAGLIRHRCSITAQREKPEW